MTGSGGVPVDGQLVLLAVVLGAAALGLATVAATRRGAPDHRTPRGSALAPLVPWLGSVLTLVLLVRGSWPGAAIVAVATAIHAGVTRARASSPGRAGRRAR